MKFNVFFILAISFLGTGLIFLITVNFAVGISFIGSSIAWIILGINQQKSS